MIFEHNDRSITIRLPTCIRNLISFIIKEVHLTINILCIVYVMYLFLNFPKIHKYSQTNYNDAPYAQTGH